MSEVILGTVQFGLPYGVNNLAGKPNHGQIYKMLDFAAKTNISILDTADAYGNASEIIGKYNKQNPGLFEINTKFIIKDLPIHLQLEQSMNILHTDQIRTYFFHNFHDFISSPQQIETLSILKRKGMIRQIGVSVYDNNEFEIAISNTEIDLIQFPFNLLDNVCQRGILMKKAKENHKELQIRSIFLQGLFLMELSKIPINLHPLKPYLLEIRNISKKIGLHVEILALQYANSQDYIDNIIIGVDNLTQLKRNIRIINDIPISEEITKEVNKINVKETTLLSPKNWN